MWILTLIALNITCFKDDCNSLNATSPAITTVEYSSKENCIIAANIANKRTKITDAWCTPK